MKKCKFCESEIPEGADVCPQCGLDVVKKEESETTGRRGRRLLPFLIAAGTIALLACVVLVVFCLEGNRAEEGADIRKDMGKAGSAVREEGMDGDLDGIEELEVVPAKAVSDLGKTWDSYTVRVNGKVVALPCEYRELQEAGLTPDENTGTDDREIVREKGYSIICMTDQKGNTLTVEAINPYGEEREVSECLVGSISLSDYDLQNEEMAVTFPGEIEIGAAQADVLKRYGEAQDSYNDEKQAEYMWMDEEKSYAGVETYFDAENGKLVQIVVRNYGF